MLPSTTTGIPVDEGALPIVIDAGSRNYKVGFSGEDSPKVIVDVAKRSDWLKSEDSTAAIVRGRIEEWNDLEVICWDALSQCGYSNNPILMTETPLCPRLDKEKLTQMVFESFNAPAFYSANQAALALYATGKTTGLVLDVGHGVTHSVPIIEGESHYHGLIGIDFAGADLTEYYHRLTGSTENCEMLKEKVCEISLTPERIKHITVKSTITLPDGQSLSVGPERYLCPEALFRPHLLEKTPRCLGIQEAIYHSVQRCDKEMRKEMYANITLSGGSTMFRNFEIRLTREVATLSQSSFKVIVAAPPEGGKFASWLGGSILASLSTFKKMLITKQEYNESGPSIIHRKCN